MTGDDDGEVSRGSVIAGRYRLVEGPFVGGAGEVWKATDQKLDDRPVALKRARFDREGPEVLRQLRRERDVLIQVLRGEGDPGPNDSTLLHNLLKGLVEESVLVPPDLALLDGDQTC